MLLKIIMREEYVLVDHEKNALGSGYIVEFIHDATENYYEGGAYACRNFNNVKFSLYLLQWSVRESWIRGYPDSQTIYIVRTIEA